jgi:hypothetical protein
LTEQICFRSKLRFCFRSPARKKTGEKADTELDQQTEPQTDQQPEHSAEWVPLRVSASHAYVRGMRVSGTVHRAVLRLVRE